MLEGKVREVLDNKQRWAQDGSRLSQSGDPDSVLGRLRKQAEESARKSQGAKWGFPPPPPPIRFPHRTVHAYAPAPSTRAVHAQRAP